MTSSEYSTKIIHYLCNQFNLPEEQVVHMLPEFRKTLLGHMDNLEEVSRGNTMKGLEKSAHTIKGAFLNLGLTDCAKIALEIEGCASRSERGTDYALLIGQLRKVVDEIVQEQSS